MEEAICKMKGYIYIPGREVCRETGEREGRMWTWAFGLQCAPYSQLLNSIKVTPPPALVSWQIPDFSFRRCVMRIKACLRGNEDAW